ncbi:MAG: hypothetical protein QXS37_01470 [Candidatus Aenigmatarchaeota archaeon]
MKSQIKKKPETETETENSELNNLPKTPLIHRGLECINVLVCKRCGHNKFILKSARRRIFQCMWCGEEYIYEKQREEGATDIDKFLSKLEKKVNMIKIINK